MKEIIAVIGTIAVGVAIRLIYDLCAKFLFNKDKTTAPKPLDKTSLKSLKKEAKAAKKAGKK